MIWQRIRPPHSIQIPRPPGRLALAAFAVGLLVSLGLLSTGSMATASPAAGQHAALAVAKARSVAPAAGNECGLPTGAGPGSLYRQSFNICPSCILDASNRNLGNPANPYWWYCTYNPSTGATDEHFGDGSQNCHLPTSAGPNSSYRTSFTFCSDCLIDASNRNLGNPANNDFWYCTYNPARNASDEHYVP
ncbi:MAG: hypothetical protein JO345_27140 [Streptosporangiaceae bacterium]|nr:hypothetical protein [Streptosporangiaceae bacterium]